MVGHGTITGKNEVTVTNGNGQKYVPISNQHYIRMMSFL